MRRITISVDDDLYGIIKDGPEAGELGGSSSISGRLVEFARIGVEHVQAVREDRARLAAYAEHRADPDHLDSITEIWEENLRNGLA